MSSYHVVLLRTIFQAASRRERGGPYVHCAPSLALCLLSLGLQCFSPYSAFAPHFLRLFCSSDRFSVKISFLHYLKFQTIPPPGTTYPPQHFIFLRNTYHLTYLFVSFYPVSPIWTGKFDCFVHCCFTSTQHSAWHVIDINEYLLNEKSIVTIDK